MNLRIVKERWYHRMLDRVTKPVAPEGAMAVEGTYVDFRVRIFKKKNKTQLSQTRFKVFPAFPEVPEGRDDKESSMEQWGNNLEAMIQAELKKHPEADPNTRPFAYQPPSYIREIVPVKYIPELRQVLFRDFLGKEYMTEVPAHSNGTPLSEDGIRHDS